MYKLSYATWLPPLSTVPNSGADIDHVFALRDLGELGSLGELELVAPLETANRTNAVGGFDRVVKQPSDIREGATKV